LLEPPGEDQLFVRHAAGLDDVRLRSHAQTIVCDRLRGLPS
jgi:hypothetical protein